MFRSSKPCCNWRHKALIHGIYIPYVQNWIFGIPVYEALNLISSLNWGFLATTFNSDISYISFLYSSFLFRSKNAPEERLGVFFYLHANVCGKTCPICRLSLTFPSWPNGNGNCIVKSHALWCLLWIVPRLRQHRDEPKGCEWLSKTVAGTDRLPKERLNLR
jgi:hypothetical protein